ncbi:flagellar FlbD family protein [Caloramator sp. mosi_1]|uniref:flagellar FlbD family protein n=1 Tax=Caloramator sp. mosi_1 TaxID=3023090 RepID=UPI00236209D2|nr:flagellar FlbD family protein [Caloramator sp. mosi_1]WDC83955.1 flagellar FlbD family protein [Caloramator sp. mosi_1]
MIKLTGLNNKEFYLNCDLIEKIEVTPDTVITTTTNKKYVVTEDPETIIQRIIHFKRAYMSTRPEVIK